MNASLFQRILGAEFFHLAPAVKNLHSKQGQFTYTGRVDIERGTGVLSRLCGLFARLPPDMRDAPLKVVFTASSDREVWMRHFNGVPMKSKLDMLDGQLRERMGLITFRFYQYRVGEELHWVARGARVLGVLTLPPGWFEEVRCREWEADGRYCFSVDAVMPWVGRLVKYEGWLQPA